jgi:hypothetical protein
MSTAVSNVARCDAAAASMIAFVHAPSALPEVVRGTALALQSPSQGPQ